MRKKAFCLPLAFFVLVLHFVVGIVVFIKKYIECISHLLAL